MIWLTFEIYWDSFSSWSTFYGGLGYVEEVIRKSKDRVYGKWK